MTAGVIVNTMRGTELVRLQNVIRGIGFSTNETQLSKPTNLFLVHHRMLGVYGLGGVESLVSRIGAESVVSSKSSLLIIVSVSQAYGKHREPGGAEEHVLFVTQVYSAWKNIMAPM